MSSSSSEATTTTPSFPSKGVGGGEALIAARGTTTMGAKVACGELGGGVGKACGEGGGGGAEVPAPVVAP